MNRIAIALALPAALALAGAAVGATTERSTAAKTTVQVTVREYRISLSTRTLPSGTVHLVVHNTGKLAHRLSISGPGLSTTTPTIAQGATRGLTLNLRGGAFTLWCPLGSHASLGMKTTMTVRGHLVASPPTNPDPQPRMDPGYGDGYGP